MQWIPRIFNKQWWQFQWRYWRGHTPWDTNTTPPEVAAFLETAPAGRALDLGCGTGTNAISMAKKGWRVLGVDFVPQAIHMARRKTARAGLSIDFRVGDVLALARNNGPFDYILDIGCLHSLDTATHRRYAAQITGILAPAGTYMLYAWMPRMHAGRSYGITVEQACGLFVPPLGVKNIVVGEEKGSPSVWYWFGN